MSEFLKLVSISKAQEIILSNIPANHTSEIVIDTVKSLGRVISSDIITDHPLPLFPRSTVDGYAVRAKDTYGASESMPAYLQIVGEVNMGTSTNISLSPGQAVLIHTGGMVPENADAVIMIEETQPIGSNELEVRKAVGSGENFLAVGEEIDKDSVVIPAGTKIRSVEIGGLMAIGRVEVPVRKKPRIGIISSGDEIVFPGSAISLGKVRDVNSYLLASLVSKWGGEPVLYGIIKDNLEDLVSVAKQAYEQCDVVLFTAGSSVSVRDVTAQAIGTLGKPGVLVHGVNIRPGKPTIIAVCSGKPVIGLPGNPVSAYVTANLFLSPIIKLLLGVKELDSSPAILAKLSINIPSQAGREDWIPVKISTSNQNLDATPIFSKSNFIFSLIAADGLIRILPDQTGLEAGKIVEVFTFE